MKPGKIFIISGPSGSGKTTLYKRLLAEDKRLVKSISVTTRSPRTGEKNSRDYFFVSPKMFDYKRRSGHFLEFQKVFDNFYGTPKKNIKKLLLKSKNVLLCIDVKGARVVRRTLPKAITIFIKTASLDVLRSRLMSRGSEDAKTIDLRLKTAQQELKDVKHYNYVIVNNELATAFAQLKKIIGKELD